VRLRHGTKLFLALRLHDNYMLLIEFRPNDLASPHVVRLTDDPPQISS
jgi:hypothetical protein